MENNNKFGLNLGQVSKKTLESDKRIEKQSNDALKAYYTNLKEQERLAEEKKNEEILNAARFSNSSVYMKNKERVKLMESVIQYNERASVAAMTDVLSKIVENALLLDTDEYVQLNPTYKVELKETVKSFLENAELNAEFRDERTVRIIESVMKALPQVSTGMYLKEEEIVDLVNDSSAKEIEGDIDSLVTDVKSRVADLVGKEQKATKEIEAEIDEIVAISEAAKAAKAEEKAKKDEKKDPKKKEEKVKLDEEDDEFELDESDDIDVEDDEDEYLEYQQSLQPDARKARKKTEIQMNPDGGLKVIIREQFVKETPRKNLLETLAFNEAMEMIAEGKQYNGDLALANAVMYITILETFNATGLLTITERDYANLISKSK
jgi:hypothetical protein